MSVSVTPPLQKILTKSFPSVKNFTDADRHILSIIRETHGDLLSLIELFERNLDILENQSSRCTDIIAILEEAGGLTVRARNYVTTPQDAEKFRDKTKDLENLFRAVLKKLDEAVIASAYQDINLPNGDSLLTRFDEKGSSTLLTQGFVLNSQVLGIREPDFETMMGVQNSRIDVMNAIDMAVTLRNIITSDISTLFIRRDFALEFVDITVLGQTAIDQCVAANEISNLIKLSTQTSTLTEPLAEPAQQETLASFAASHSMEDI